MPTLHQPPDPDEDEPAPEETAGAHAVDRMVSGLVGKRDKKPPQDAAPTRRTALPPWPSPTAEANPVLALLIEQHAYPFPLPPSRPGVNGAPASVKMGYAFPLPVQAYMALRICGAVLRFSQWAQRAAEWWTEQLDPHKRKPFADLLKGTGAAFAGVEVLVLVASQGQPSPSAHASNLASKIRGRQDLPSLDRTDESARRLFEQGAKWLADEVSDVAQQKGNPQLIPYEWAVGLAPAEAALACLTRLAAFELKSTKSDHWHTAQFRDAASAWWPPGVKTTEPSPWHVLDAALLLCRQSEPISRAFGAEVDDLVASFRAALKRDRSGQSAVDDPLSGKPAAQEGDGLWDGKRTAQLAPAVRPSVPATGSALTKLTKGSRLEQEALLDKPEGLEQLRALYFLRVLFSELFYNLPKQIQHPAPEKFFVPVLNLLLRLKTDDRYAPDAERLAKSISDFGLDGKTGKRIVSSEGLPDCFQPSVFWTKPEVSELERLVGSDQVAGRFESVRQIALLISDAFRDVMLQAHWAALGIAGQPPDLPYLEGRMRNMAMEMHSPANLPPERLRERSLLYRAVLRMASTDLLEQVRKAYADASKHLPHEQISAAWSQGHSHDHQ